MNTFRHLLTFQILSCLPPTHTYRVTLPEYVLDFGYIILGKVLRHTVQVTNTGFEAVTFRAVVKGLAGAGEESAASFLSFFMITVELLTLWLSLPPQGFSVELEHVENLPIGKSQTFSITFDPKGADVQLGTVSVVMLIQVHMSAFSHRLRSAHTRPERSHAYQRRNRPPVCCRSPAALRCRCGCARR